MSSIYGMYNAYKAKKIANAMHKKELQAALEAAGRNLQATEENAPLIPRRADEGFAARGVNESTFGVGLGGQEGTGHMRAQHEADRRIASARTRLMLAQERQNAFKKMLKYQRQQFYGEMGSAIIGNLLAGATLGIGGGGQHTQGSTEGGGGGDWGGGGGGDFGGGNWA